MKNFLFICSANKKRSKTAEDYFSSIHPELQFLSAGTNKTICEKEGTVFVTEEMLEWADVIFAMEEKHRKEIRENTNSKIGNKIKVLNIPDDFKYYSKELILILENKTKSYF